MRKLRTLGMVILTYLSAFSSLCAAASLSVSWNATSAADLAGYKVYYGTQSKIYGTAMTVQGATSCLINNVQNGNTYYVAVSSFDTAGNESVKSTEISIYVPAKIPIPNPDTTPPTGSVAINSNAASTSTGTVTLSLSASDTGGTVTGMKISNDGLIYSNEIAYAASYTWTLTSGYGTKTVYVLFKDASGNWATSPAKDTIQYVLPADTTPPTGRVVINSGAATTASRQVILSLSASDSAGTVIGMKISNNGSSYSSEMVYSTSCPWTLSAGSGTKRVYALFKDSSGNWMQSPATDTIKVLKATGTSTNTSLSSLAMVPLPDGSSAMSIMNQPTSPAGEDVNAAVIESIPSVIGNNETCRTGLIKVKPVITSPENNEVEVGLRPVLKTTALADSYPLVEWEISTDSGEVILDLKSTKHRRELLVPDMVLEPGLKHYCRVRYYDSAGNETEWSDPVSFDTVLLDIADLNLNGIPDDQELLSCEDVDLDMDGVIDSGQSDMKALVTEVGDEYVSLKGSTNCRTLHSFKSVDPASIPDTYGRPHELPFGLIDFKAEVARPGDYAEVVIHLSEPAPPGAKWYMYDEALGWRAYPHVAFSEDRRMVTVLLKDGDREYGDADGVANGVIIDPSGLGVDEAVQGASLDGNSCFMSVTREKARSNTPWAAWIALLLACVMVSESMSRARTSSGRTRHDEEGS